MKSHTRGRPAVGARDTSQPLHRFKAELFKTLGHPLRIQILEILRSGEVSVRDLLRELEVEPSTASQQLGVLRARGIVESRRTGAAVLYRVRDHRMIELLDVGRRVFANQVHDMQHLLDAQEREEDAHASRSRPATKPKRRGRQTTRRAS
jgi:ArsR family transcriptional regulator